VEGEKRSRGDIGVKKKAVPGMHKFTTGTKKCQFITGDVVQQASGRNDTVRR